MDSTSLASFEVGLDLIGCTVTTAVTVFSLSIVSEGIPVDDLALIVFLCDALDPTVGVFGYLGSFVEIELCLGICEAYELS